MYKFIIPVSKNKNVSPNKIALACINEATNTPLPLTHTADNNIVLGATDMLSILRALEQDKGEINKWLATTIGYTFKVTVVSKADGATDEIKVV